MTPLLVFQYIVAVGAGTAVAVGAGIVAGFVAVKIGLVVASLLD